MAKIEKLKLYGEVTSQMPMFGDDYFSPSKVYDFLEANKDANTIEVHIQTYGGNVDDGFAIYSSLKNSGKEILMYIDGYCMSAGTVIATAAKLENLYISKTDEFLIHCPFIPPFTLADSYTADELKELEVDMRRIEDKLINHYVDYYGKSVEDIKAIMDKNLPMTGQEAFDSGFVGKLIDIKAEDKKKIRAVASFNNKIINNKKNDKMTKENEDTLKQIKNFFGELINVIKPLKKDMVLKDVTGAEIELEKTEGEPAVGDKVISPEAGEFLMENGTTIVIANKEITEIRPKKEEIPTDEVTNLKKQIETLTKENTDLKALQVENANLKNEVAENNKIINKVRAMASDAKIEGLIFNKVEPKVLSEREEIEQIKAKVKGEKK